MFPFVCQRLGRLQQSSVSVFSKVQPHRLAFPRRCFPSSAVHGVNGGVKRVVGWWLAGCCGLVGGAVVLGGITRLTESGLSMTKWHLVKGMRPPRSQLEWEQEFNRYKEFPEYKYVHQDLTLQKFKRIFYMEYVHRMWGRLVGLAVLVPAAGFWACGYLDRPLKARAIIYGGLVLAQGLMGWWMVRSGLVTKPEPGDVPRVSQYRLASHLGLALLLYSSMFYTAIGILSPPTTTSAVKGVGRLRHVTHAAAGLVFLTALSGAFVAGLDAGLVYNSFPKMAGQWIPEDWLQLSPRIKNFFENPSTVQFDHRVLGMTTASVVLGCWWLARGVGVSRRARLAANCMAGMALTQAGLGIATLLMYVPTSLAACHQSGSLILLSFTLWLMSELRKTATRL